MRTAMNQQAIDEQLGTLPKPWALNAHGHLAADYRFDDFIQAMEFGQAVGQLAETANHHPDLRIGWGRCGVELWTHDAGGLTPADFRLARKISDCYDALP
jgi:4a-hydroxytetrahydrobiopterin dehydratase